MDVSDDGILPGAAGVEIVAEIIQEDALDAHAFPFADAALDLRHGEVLRGYARVDVPEHGGMSQRRVSEDGEGVGVVGVRGVLDPVSQDDVPNNSPAWRRPGAAFARLMRDGYP